MRICLITKRTPPPSELFTIRQRKLWHHDCLNLVDADLVAQAVRDYDSPLAFI